MKGKEKKRRAKEEPAGREEAWRVTGKSSAGASSEQEARPAPPLPEALHGLHWVAARWMSRPHFFFLSVCFCIAQGGIQVLVHARQGLVN